LLHPVKPRNLRIPFSIFVSSLVLCFILGLVFPPKPHLIFIGLDGVPPELLGYLMDEGTLPNISHLAQRGTFDKLITHKYTQTRLIWPIIYSGYSPAQNGISIDMVSNYAGLDCKSLPKCDRFQPFGRMWRPKGVGLW